MQASVEVASGTGQRAAHTTQPLTVRPNGHRITHSHALYMMPHSHIFAKGPWGFLGPNFVSQRPHTSPVVPLAPRLFFKSSYASLVIPHTVASTSGL